MSESYLVSLQEPTDPVGHLVCLHHAGGASRLFTEWPGLLEASLTVTAVELPGRGRRFGEPIPESLEAVATELIDEIPSRWFEGRPPVFFGHSMGGALAYELSRRLQEYDRTPARVVTSGVSPVDADREYDRHELSDEELKRELREFGGTPTEVLEKPELMDLYLPVIRADLRLVETYEFAGREPLETPITAIAGRDDPQVDEEKLRRWSDFTDAGSTTEVFPGGHFFVDEHREQVVKWLETHLREAGNIGE